MISCELYRLKSHFCTANRRPIMNASAQVDFIGHVDGPVYDWRESIVLRASFVFVLILWAYNRVVSSDLEKFLLSHPLVGYPRGQWLKSTRASFKSILGTSRLAAEGYKTVRIWPAVLGETNEDLFSIPRMTSLSFCPFFWTSSALSFRRLSCESF